MALKVLERLEKISSFPEPGKSLKTEHGLESLGICFDRSVKVLDFH